MWTPDEAKLAKVSNKIANFLGVNRKKQFVKINLVLTVVQNCYCLISKPDPQTALRGLNA